MFGFLHLEEVIAETFPEQYNYVYANLPQNSGLVSSQVEDLVTERDFLFFRISH